VFQWQKALVLIVVVKCVGWVNKMKICSYCNKGTRKTNVYGMCSKCRKAYQKELRELGSGLTKDNKRGLR
jgi:hypothetical protein